MCVWQAKLGELGQRLVVCRARLEEFELNRAEVGRGKGLV